VTSAADSSRFSRRERVWTVIGFAVLGVAVLAALSRGGVVALAAMGCVAEGYSCSSPLIPVTRDG
jgi:hypothetical protein